MTTPATDAIVTRPMRVYFNTTTGAVIGHDTGNDVPFVQTGHDHIETDGSVHPNPLAHTVDLATKTLRDMTASERAAANAPTELDVKSARFHELSATDWRENQPTWKEHRQALRDITKAANAVAMVKAWPMRPDGTDAIPHLRKRLPENT